MAAHDTPRAAVTVAGIGTNEIGDPRTHRPRMPDADATNGDVAEPCHVARSTARTVRSGRAAQAVVHNHRVLARETPADRTQSRIRGDRRSGTAPVTGAQVRTRPCRSAPSSSPRRTCAAWRALPVNRVRARSSRQSSAFDGRVPLRRDQARKRAPGQPVSAIAPQHPSTAINATIDDPIHQPSDRSHSPILARRSAWPNVDAAVPVIAPSEGPASLTWTTAS